MYNTVTGRATWASHITSNVGRRLSFQTDGKIVIYGFVGGKANQVVWQTSSSWTPVPTGKARNAVFFFSTERHSTASVFIDRQYKADGLGAPWVTTWRRAENL
jgi:hypothetical protein